MEKTHKHTHALVENSQALRKNMTPEEKQLWYQFLKKLPLTVKRQEIFRGYILDFYIAKSKLAIEIDGIQHKLPEHKASDEKRDRELMLYGIKVLRYTNKDVNEKFNVVCDDILKNLRLTVDDVSFI